MLTMVLLMRALDPLIHEQETDFYLEKLVEVDGFRKGYYRDLSEYNFCHCQLKIKFFIFFRGWFVSNTML